MFCVILQTEPHKAHKLIRSGFEIGQSGYFISRIMPAIDVLIYNFAYTLIFMQWYDILNIV